MILSRKVLLVAALAASCATVSLAAAAAAADGNSLNKEHMHNFLLRGAGNGRKLKKKNDTKKVAEKDGDGEEEKDLGIVNKAGGTGDSPFFYPETGTSTPPATSSKKEEKGKVNAKTKQDKQKEEQVAREFAEPSTSFYDLLGQIGSGAAIPKDESQSNIETRGNGDDDDEDEVDIGDGDDDDEDTPNCNIEPKLPTKSLVTSVFGGADECKGSCECASDCCVKYWSQICMDPLAGGGYWGDRCID